MFPPKAYLSSDFLNLFVVSTAQKDLKKINFDSAFINANGVSVFLFNCEFYSSGLPTYWPSSDTNKIPDPIDFFVVNGIKKNHISVEGNYDLSSDHTPVILSLSEA